MQNENLIWVLEFGIPIICILALPAYIIWVFRRYVEAIVYNSQTPQPRVPQNSRHEYVLNIFKYHMNELDILLLFFFAVHSILIPIAGYLLGGIQGVALGIVVGIVMGSDLRYGLRLQTRIETKLVKDKSLHNYDAKLFG